MSNRSTDKSFAQTKEEHFLYLIKTDANPKTQMLFIRKLLPQDIVRRVFIKALEMSGRIKTNKEIFKLVYLK